MPPDKAGMGIRSCEPLASESVKSIIAAPRALRITERIG